jgi:GDP-mannose 6-dehydrogenase
MNVFKEDRKLNISTAYLTPGFAFGGSCLPKDLRALVHAAGRADVDVPLLGSVLAANEAHLRRTLDAILSSGRRRVAMLGLSFKPGTDDLRESPLVELAERLVGKGFELSIYDPAVVKANLVGANLRYVETHLPHLSALLVEDLQPAVENAEVIIVGAPFPGVEELLRDDQLVVDLVRLSDATRRSARGRYVGAAW